MFVRSTLVSSGHDSQLLSSRGGRGIIDHSVRPKLSQRGRTRSGVEMSFLELLVTRAAPQASLNYPPLPMETGNFSDTHHYPRSKVFSKALNA